MITTMVGKFQANLGGNPAALNTYNSFTVNTAVTQVAISQAAAPWAFVFVSPWHLVISALQRADNFKIVSLGLRLPYHFISGVIGPEITIVGTDGNVNPWEVVATGSGVANGSFHLPDVNYEYSINQYFPWPQTGAISGFDAMFLGAFITEFDVSMIGVDALLNTEVLYPEPFIKIEHTLPLL